MLTFCDECKGFSGYFCKRWTLPLVSDPMSTLDGHLQLLSLPLLAGLNIMK